MLRFLLIIFYFFSSSARRNRRTRNRCFFRKAGKRALFTRSDTVFNVTNTFLQVNTTLTVQAATRWGWPTTPLKQTITYYLPTEALISSLKIELSDGSVYSGAVYPNAQADAMFRNNSFGSNKALIIERWTNEQFAAVTFMTRFLRREIMKISIGWEMILEVEFDSLNFYFPVPIADGFDHSVIRIAGSITELQPIKLAVVDSPGPLTLSPTETIAPTCTKQTPNGPVPCSDFTTTSNRVDVLFEATAGEYRKWLNDLRAPRLYPWSKKVSSSSSDSYRRRSRRRLRRRGRGGAKGRIKRGKARRKKRERRSQYQYDLVFAMSYNHSITIPINGVPTDVTYAFQNFETGTLYTNPEGTCWVHGLTINRAFQQVFGGPAQPPVPLYPLIRRATFFVDDYSNLTLTYWANVKLAIKAAIEFGAENRPSPIFAGSPLNDTRSYNRFRIVVLVPSGAPAVFPDGVNFPGGPFVDQRTTNGGGVTALQAALQFIDNLPPPSMGKQAAYTFDDVKSNFTNVLGEYVNLTRDVTQDKSEISDVFLFSNSKAPGTNGNFVRKKRIEFLDAVAVQQDRLRAFTTRTYGQPIFAFGFGPNADFNLLSNLTAHNWGSTRMAFDTTSADNIVQQILTWYRGIGRVVASDLHISETLQRYGPNGNQVFPQFDIPVPNSLTEAGFNIPLLRDLHQYNVAWNAPNQTSTIIFQGTPFTFPLQQFAYTLQFTPAGALGSFSIDVPANNLTSLLIGAPRDLLGVTQALQTGQDACQQAAVTRINTYEEALRLGSTKTPAQLNNLIEEQGLMYQLQTSQTAIVVADVARFQTVPAGGSSTFSVDPTNDAAVVSLRKVVLLICLVILSVF